VVAGPRRVEIVPAEPQRPGPGEVLVAVEGCGVCGSNVPVWEGRPWFEYPLAPGAPGHEGWGEVAAVGDGVGSLRAGDRITFLAERAFADEVVVHEDVAVRLPDVLAGRPVPGEALGCCFNIARRARFEPGQTVAVVGAGFLGIVVGALAAQAGARVVTLSRRRVGLDLAAAMGAEHTLRTGDERWRDVAAVREIAGGDGCDVVVEAVGLQEPLDLAGELTATGGRLVIAGFHQDGRRSVDLQLWGWRGIDVVNAHERDPQVAVRGMRDAVDALAAGTLDPAPLYTHEVPLEALASAMDGLVERPDGFLKALVRT